MHGAQHTQQKQNNKQNNFFTDHSHTTENTDKATMKLSALALALLAAPIVGTTAQHGGGGGNGGSTTTKYKKMIRGADDLATTATAGPRPALPLILNADGGDGDTTTGELVKTCASLSATGQNGCNANTSCSWCVSGAIPSACYPTSMVSQLAGGVFQCDKKETISTTTTSTTTFDVQHQAAEMTPAAATSSKKVQTFNLKESITLTLSSSEVDKSFCDASSPLSLAGYMNGK